MAKEKYPKEFKERILRVYNRKIWTTYCERIATFLMQHDLQPDETEIICCPAGDFEYKARDVPIAFLTSKGRATPRGIPRS